MRRMLVGAMVLVGLMGSSVMAQGPLKLGDSIQVSYHVVDGNPAVTVDGFFHEVRDDSLTVLTFAESDTLTTLRIPTYLVDGIEVYRRDHYGSVFMGLGVLAGGLLGAIHAKNETLCQGGDFCLITDDQAAAMDFVGGALLGGVAGYFTGSMIRRVYKVEITETEVPGWSLTPTVRNGIGFSASIRTN